MRIDIRNPMENSAITEVVFSDDALILVDSISLDNAIQINSVEGFLSIPDRDVRGLINALERVYDLKKLD